MPAHPALRLDEVAADLGPRVVALAPRVVALAPRVVALAPRVVALAPRVVDPIPRVADQPTPDTRTKVRGYLIKWEVD